MDNQLPNISAYILCGGKSTRMQSEKGLVRYKGKPFISWIIEAILPTTPNIILVTESNDYSFTGFPTIKDVFTDKGPMGGIYTALNHSKTESNLILSCDIPKITTDLLRDLIDESEVTEAPITFLNDHKNDYPLIGVYQKAVSTHFYDSISANKLKLCTLVNMISHHKMMVRPECKSQIQNINSKAELRALYLLNK